MSNRRVKSLALDDDDYDDYDDYDEDDNAYKSGNNDLSAEDREQMRQGTVKVREALGPGLPVTDSEIQAALWHYYYDVEKSVSYLESMLFHNTPGACRQLTLAGQRKSIPDPTKKQTVGSKSKHASSFCSHSLATERRSYRGGHDGLEATFLNHDTDGHQEFVSSTACSAPFSVAEFFKDSPWLQIPAHRKGEILVEPLYPRLGLLGGASSGGKMSKLAALAAKRRQKESGRSDSTISTQSGSQDDYSAALKKLRISQTTKAKVGTDSTTESTAQDSTNAGINPRTTGQDGNATEPKTGNDLVADKTPGLSIPVDANIRARPSAFASIMTSHGVDNHLSASPALFPCNEVAKSFNFAEPSPDDVVTKAQNHKGRG